MKLTGIILYEFSLTLIDSEIQMWNTEVAQQPGLIMYRIFKHAFEPQAYLSFDMPMYLCKIFSRFRISNHNLEIELGKHRNIPQEQNV